MKHTLWLLIASFLFLSTCSTENSPDYTISVSPIPEEGGTVTPQSGSFEEGDVVSIEAVPADGWMFVGWEQDLSSMENPVNVTMNNDYEIFGVFERIEHSLDVTIEGDGTVNESVIQQKSTDYLQGVVVELTAIPDEGSEFTRWSGDINGTDNPVNITMDTAKSITATFIEEGSGNDLRDTQTIVVDVTNPLTGRTWMDRNLGASRAAESKTDTEAYGDLYQWGRGADGHQKRNSPVTSQVSNSATPDHGDFIISGENDWRTNQTPELWQVGSGVNNPCPVGYRIPTKAEWETEIDSWPSEGSDGAIGSVLRLPVAGTRSGSDGNNRATGAFGFYWSSTKQSESEAYIIAFDDNETLTDTENKSTGVAIRCIKM